MSSIHSPTDITTPESSYSNPEVWGKGPFIFFSSDQKVSKISEQMRKYIDFDIYQIGFQNTLNDLFQKKTVKCVFPNPGTLTERICEIIPNKLNHPNDPIQFILAPLGQIESEEHLMVMTSTIKNNKEQLSPYFNYQQTHVEISPDIVDPASGRILHTVKGIDYKKYGFSLYYNTNNPFSPNPWFFFADPEYVSKCPTPILPI